MAWPARAAIYVGFVLGVALIVGVAGLSGAALAQTDDGTADDETPAENASFGEQVASFMQSTAVEANSSVENGMWRQSVEERDNPEAALHARERRLERKISQIESRTTEMDGEGERAGVVYTARASALRAELATVHRSIDETADVAQRHGVDPAVLDELRERAGSVSGPEVAAAARELTDAGQGPPGTVPANDGERGPPEGPPGQAGNATGDGPGDPGPPDRGGGDGPNAGTGGGPSDGGGDGGPPENGGRDGPPGDGDRGGPPANGGTGGDGGTAGGSGQAGSGQAGSGGSGQAGSGGGGEPAGSGGGPPS